jgi:hypothetical protein
MALEGAPDADVVRMLRLASKHIPSPDELQEAEAAVAAACSSPMSDAHRAHLVPEETIGALKRSRLV